MHKNLVITILCTSLAGCGSFQTTSNTYTTNTNGYTYVPIDPLPVSTTAGTSCKRELSRTSSYTPLERNQLNTDTPIYKKLLASLPDNAVRMVVENITSSGTLTYGVGKSGGKYERYKITADYTSSDTINMQFWISKRVLFRTNSALYKESKLNASQESDYNKMYFYLTDNIDYDKLLTLANGSITYSGNVLGSEQYVVKRAKQGENPPTGFHSYNIPVYIGIGIRITSEIEITGSNANISGIGEIGLEANAHRLKGNLVVQTLGVNGKAVASALPMQSELNATTAQNALIATASIKTLLYSDDTEIYPRVVGLYLPFPTSKALANSIISELSSNSIPWERPCEWIDSKQKR